MCLCMEYAYMDYGHAWTYMDYGHAYMDMRIWIMDMHVYVYMHLHMYARTCLWRRVRLPTCLQICARSEYV